ncbi:hypothetical protein [Aureivirga marina]|uniref:hypothetical protein n=1 Tax=Aureivirga marina TaxID=1182451 RepID=UPI0018C9B3BE|nr:hypothetical protein [Aureivirga marina]
MIITKEPIEITINSRSNKKETILVALDIVKYVRDKELGKFLFEVVDYKVKNQNGIFIYEEFDRNVRSKSLEEVNIFWNITGDKSTPELFDLALSKGLLLETQQDPVHNSTSEIWELHTKQV